MKIAVFSPKFSELETFNSQKFLILKSQYDQLGHDLTYIDYPDYLSEEVLQNSITKINSSIIKKIVFMPFKDSSFVFISEIISRLNLSISIVFHLDGSFVFNSLRWKQIEPVLKGRSIEFVCSSTSQQKLVQKFVFEKIKVQLLSPSIFSEPVIIDSKSISEFRKNNDVSDGELVFICTGSMERQKFILELSKVFYKLSEQLKIKANLWLVGNFSDTGIPLVGRSQLPFEYYQQWVNLQSVFGESLKVRFFDNQSDDNMELFYQSSDYYINLSKIDDDDFNYDVLQASRHGLKLILSKWGSHTEFAKISSTRFVRLRDDAPFLHPDINVLAKLVVSSCFESRKLEKEHRHDLMLKACEEFSLDKSIKQLQAILNNKNIFSGFTEDLDDVCDSFKKNPYAPFVDIASLGAYNQTYKNIYASYF